jgi:hypothetical protein
MRQRLLINGIVAALVLSGWSGALAAAMCPRAEAASTDAHACCVKEAGEESAHCPMAPGTMGETGRTHDGGHDEGATSSPHEATEISAHHQQHAVEVSAGVRTATGIRRADDSCAHCIGRSTFPPASLKMGAGEGAKRDDNSRPARAREHVARPFASFAPEIVPSQGAPPGNSAARRRVLIGVFLI